MRVRFEFFVAKGEYREPCRVLPSASMGGPSPIPEFFPVWVAPLTDERFGIVFFTLKSAIRAGKFVIVEGTQEHISGIADDVDCPACFVELRVLIGEFKVCFDVDRPIGIEVCGHFSVEILDFGRDIPGFLGRAVERGVEHEAEPGVAALGI